MTDVLLSLGSLTLGGSVAIVLLALTGHFTRTRYAARWRCWAWALLCLRLAIPLTLPQQERAPIQVEVPSAFVQAPAPAPTDNPSVQVPALSVPDSPAQPTESTVSQQPERTLNFSLSPAQIIAGVWLLGAAGILGWSLIAHVRFLRYLRRWAAPVEDKALLSRFQGLSRRAGIACPPALLRCRGLGVPMLAGLFHPVVLLPWEEPEDDGLDYALLHELIHLRRRDIWLKTLCLWVRCLYWFNPLIHVMARLMDRDMELACDEGVLDCLPEGEYGAYGRTILTAGKKNNSPSAPTTRAL